MQTVKRVGAGGALRYLWGVDIINAAVLVPAGLWLGRLPKHAQRLGVVLEQETIGAVIEAYGAGEIELDAVHRETPKSGTHEVVPGGKTYTLLTVARFLGWTKAAGTQATNSCRVAFDAWHAARPRCVQGERSRPRQGEGLGRRRIVARGPGLVPARRPPASDPFL